jgi:hypothetical protein
MMGWLMVAMTSLKFLQLGSPRRQLFLPGPARGRNFVAADRGPAGRVMIRYFTTFIPTLCLPLDTSFGFRAVNHYDKKHKESLSFIVVVRPKLLLVY